MASLPSGYKLGDGEITEGDENDLNLYLIREASEYTAKD
jgi:hypothetical protein